MNRSLTLIGMGEDGIDGLSAAARTLIAEADIIVGSGRLLGMLPPLSAALYNWPSPFDPMIDRIRSWGDKRVVILATGDPMNYGVGALLAPRLKQDLTIIPTPSAFSLAAARMGWSLPEVEMVSIHGRDAALLEPVIYPQAKILALTEGDESIRAAADRLKRRNYGESRMTVMEHMGGPLERQLAFTAAKPPREPSSDLSTIAIECIPSADAALLPRIPGLPDEAFAHDGQLTKREVRAITLSGLAPVPGALLWDIGAGCGSIAIEWLRAARATRAIAFEPNEKRGEFIAANARCLGTPELEIVTTPAPEALERRPAPDAVFLGGAVSDTDIAERAWQALKPQGRFVANAVTLEGETAIADYQSRHGGEIIRIKIAHSAPLGGKRVFRPHLEVTQWRAVKP
jgi:precorrin-6Y C5,15-methyltransferase (decarboxylating)